MEGLKDVLWLAMATILGAGLHAQGQLGDAPTGVKLLTEETQEEAIACGQSGADCAVKPYLLCPSGIDRYSAWIATPYSRIASSIFNAVERHQRLRTMEPGLANRLGAGVYVSPRAASFDQADSIQRVVIRRGDQIIQPTTTTLAPIAIENAAGDRKQLSRGFFAFPLDAFSPASDITVVLIGPSGESSCSLSRLELATMH
jgi:hypothetical protein